MLVYMCVIMCLSVCVCERDRVGDACVYANGKIMHEAQRNGVCQRGVDV
jgi:hypothetical protein